MPTGGRKLNPYVIPSVPVLRAVFNAWLKYYARTKLWDLMKLSPEFLALIPFFTQTSSVAFTIMAYYQSVEAVLLGLYLLPFSVDADPEYVTEFIAKLLKD